MTAIQMISLTLLCVLSAGTHSLSFGKCPKPAVQQDFDPTMYLGKWYENQKLPTFFQKGECATAIYSLESPGVIDVLNKELLKDGRVNAINGSAKVKDPSEPAKLEVSFFESTPPGPYWVLSTDYDNYSLVYGCSEFGPFRSEFTWILSREPTLDEEIVEELHAILTSVGVDVNKMVMTNQDEDYCRPVNQ
ncbi:apolipoprotein Da, duplicate 2 [Genypterus blacodes]|uniref:apolipoprotein Da, duplicate 2 n=1 Tax=Genypterus blacodes TaxID=154954 RepID=UPI003F7738F9